MHRLPYKSSSKEEEYEIGECIHIDLGGPNTPSIGGNKFFMLLKDRKTGYRQVYFLKHKSDAFEYFKEFCNLVTTQLNKRIKVIRCDRGLEFCNRRFEIYLKERGIKMCTSVPYCPQQNGRIEREMRTIVESARSMLHPKQLPEYLWAEAIATAVYALNRTTNTHNRSMTPYEAWYGKKPDVSRMHPFGTIAYNHITDVRRTKFNQKSEKTLFVGYCEDSENYRLYDPEKHRVIFARNVKFVDQQRTAEILIPCNTIKDKVTATVNQEDIQARAEESQVVEQENVKISADEDEVQSASDVENEYLEPMDTSENESDEIPVQDEDDPMDGKNGEKRKIATKGRKRKHVM